jgi:serralysin
MTLYNQAGNAASSSYSGDSNIDGLLAGTQWARGPGTTAISFSFPWSNGPSALFSYGPEATAAHGAVNQAQRADVLGAFQAWANVANIRFSEVIEDSAGNVGDIRVAFSEAVGNYWGWAYYPGAHPANGDIWIHTRYLGESFDPGTYNYHATLHEIGHAIGLKHPFEGSPTLSAYDNRLYTVMSYTDPANAWWFNPQTGQNEYLIESPMVYDIQAIQHLYGANTSYQAGDTVYAFDPADPFMKALWDAGGTDTLDFSSFTGACAIDLTPGSYSSLGFTGLPALKSLGIAFDCTIENATGGSGRDTLLGNAAINRLAGGAGDDLLKGSSGDDWLEGGAGKDTLDGGAGADAMHGGAGNDIYLADSGSDLVVEQAGEGADLVKASVSYALIADVENLTLIGTGGIAGSGNDLANTIVGNKGANTITGLGGADVLKGGGGVDWLQGGAGRDRLYGEAGADSFVFADGEFSGTTSSTCDQILDFSRANGDRIHLSLVDANAANGAAGNDAFKFIGTTGFHRTPGELRYQQISGNTYVQGDTNGDGAADFWIRVDGLHVLGVADFVL